MPNVDDEQAWREVMRIEMERTSTPDLNKVAWHGFIDTRNDTRRGCSLQPTHWLRFVKQSEKVPAAGLTFVGEWSAPTAEPQALNKVAQRHELRLPHKRANKAEPVWAAAICSGWIYPMTPCWYAPYHERRNRQERGYAFDTTIDDKHYMEFLYHARWSNPSYEENRHDAS